MFELLFETIGSNDEIELCRETLELRKIGWVGILWLMCIVVMFWSLYVNLPFYFFVVVSTCDDGILYGSIW